MRNCAHKHFEAKYWVNDAKKGMENALKANPLDVRQQYEKELRDLQEAYGEAMLVARELLVFSSQAVISLR